MKKFSIKIRMPNGMMPSIATVFMVFFALLDIATASGLGNGLPGYSPKNTVTHTLVIGKVTGNPKKHYGYLKPLAKYAVRHMRDLGIVNVEVLMAGDVQKMTQYLKSGRVDWVSETLLPAAVFMQEAGAQVLVKTLKKGASDYHTIFFCRKDREIRSLRELLGKTIALEDPGSTSAFLIPAHEMIKNGLALIRLASPYDKPPADKVGFVFSNQEINSSFWVYKGVVDAAAFNNLDWNKNDHFPTLYKEELKIFHRTTSFPRAVELVRKDLDPKVKKRLRHILLNAHQDPKANSALRAYFRTKRFSEVETADEKHLKDMYMILNYVQRNLE